MVVGLVVVAVLAMAALAVALGVSLGRYGDREDEYTYRQQMAEAVNQLDERLKQLEPPTDNDQRT
jgi:ABC-type transporter Mla subunit MlaD